MTFYTCRIKKKSKKFYLYIIMYGVHTIINVGIIYHKHLFIYKYDCINYFSFDIRLKSYRLLLGKDNFAGNQLHRKERCTLIHKTNHTIRMDNWKLIFYMLKNLYFSNLQIVYQCWKKWYTDVYFSQNTIFSQISFIQL